MTPDDGTDKLDADLKAQDAVMAKLQSTIAENKEASGEIKKSLDNLDAATQKLEKEEG
jgi:septal ring factor EnvC (AmiA/AmiB activator)